MFVKILLPILTLITAWAAGLGMIYTDWDWYESLTKPELNPPRWLFGVVWPILYVLMGAVSFYNAKHISLLFVVQLFLNGLWPWIFFVNQSPGLAIFIIIPLIVANVLILNKLWFNKKIGSFFSYMPYLFLLFFASYLNISISVIN